MHQGQSSRPLGKRRDGVFAEYGVKSPVAFNQGEVAHAVPDE
jgi:hypothetical protein